MMNFVFTEPNQPPVNVQGHNTSSTSIWVDWDTVPVADQNGIILSYTVKYVALPGGIPRTAVVRCSNHQRHIEGSGGIHKL